METQRTRKVLLATDFSDGGDAALDQAIDVAKGTGAEIEILHVIELAEEFPFGTVYFDADYGTLYAYVDRELSRRAERIRSAGVPCVTKILEGGNASSEVAKRGADIGADLIVVGTHGRTGLAHVTLGSVAERIVRRASCPVLTVPYSRKAA